MFLQVDKAEYLSEYRVWLEFDDGSAGEVDLLNELDGKVFMPLKNTDYFKAFALQGRTLSWEDGTDFAPEFLQELMVSRGKIASRT